MVKQTSTDRILELINDELDNNCDVMVYPEVCKRRQGNRLRSQIVNQVLNLVAKEGLSIDGAIAQVEMELSHSVE